MANATLAQKKKTVKPNAVHCIANKQAMKKPVFASNYCTYWRCDLINVTPTKWQLYSKGQFYNLELELNLKTLVFIIKQT